MPNSNIGYATSGEVVYSSAIDEAPVAPTTHTFVMAACLNAPNVTDIDGNSYPVVQIGNRCWMAENLRTTRYRDGTPIPNVTDNLAWTQLNSGAWSSFLNSPVNDATYGKLYNWYAAADPNICPMGWHVPTDVEWQQLEAALGMPTLQLDDMAWRGANQNVGGKMKTTSLWYLPNTGATNESAFSGLPGGYRNGIGGGFIGLGLDGYWWTSSESGSVNAWDRELSNGDSGVGRYTISKRSGCCVRCVKD